MVTDLLVVKSSLQIGLIIFFRFQIYTAIALVILLVFYDLGRS